MTFINPEHFPFEPRGFNLMWTNQSPSQKYSTEALFPYTQRIYYRHAVMLQWYSENTIFALSLAFEQRFQLILLSVLLLSLTEKWIDFIWKDVIVEDASSLNSIRFEHWPLHSNFNCSQFFNSSLSSVPFFIFDVSEKIIRLIYVKFNRNTVKIWNWRFFRRFPYNEIQIYPKIEYIFNRFSGRFELHCMEITGKSTKFQFWKYFEKCW